ncbi:MAG: F0F1 ATP synthase subunit epsilon [Rhodospirillaceae bacterium]|nr:F0F1 ATP synthase subunit epsilon [Rhodospirillaceae bacterium]
MAETLEFELVSPEKLLMQRSVEMVVVPGAEGNFAAMRGHAPVISTLRPGVIDVYDKRPEIADRIFVAGGFAEVTANRCTVLAEEAVPLSDLDSGALDQAIRDLAEDVTDAKEATARVAAEKALNVAKAKRAALRR